MVVNTAMLSWMQVTDTQIAREADFAVMICGQTLEPTYPEGTILAVKRREVANHDLGLFVYHGEAFVRRLYHGRKVTRVEALCCKIPNIRVRDPKELTCMGKVLGQVTLNKSSSEYLFLFLRAFHARHRSRSFRRMQRGR